MGIFSLFTNNKKLEVVEKKNVDLNKKIVELKKQIEEKDRLIAKTKEKVQLEKDNLGTQSKAKEGLDYSKQWSVMEKNLRSLREENKLLSSNLNFAKQILPKEQWHYSFRVDLDDFYPGSKFDNIRTILKNAEIKYLQDLTEDIFSTILKDDKNVEEGKVKFLNYKNGIIDWDIKTFLLKGDKVTKTYQKYRKFYNILAGKNIEFMIELENFNFESLLDLGFSQLEIDILVEIFKSYIAEKKYS